MNILDAGEPVEMLIDDYFPFWIDNEEPSFSKGGENMGIVITSRKK